MKRNLLARTLSGLLLWFDNSSLTFIFARSDSSVSLKGGLLGFVQRTGLLVVGLFLTAEVCMAFLNAVLDFLLP